MHNYPSLCVHGDELSSYKPGYQFIAIQRAKDDIEKAVGHPVQSFRSGQWSCDHGVEYACDSLGFTSISNHDSTYLQPSGIWQIATMKDYDILLEPRMFWRCLKWDDGHTLIPLFSHPMILFDHATNQPREKMLQDFFLQIDEFRLKYPDVHFMTTTAAAALLQYKPPSIPIRMAAGTISILLILVSFFISLHRRGACPA